MIDPPSPSQSSATAKLALVPEWRTETRAGVCQNDRQSFHASVFRATECVCHIFLTGLPANEAAGFLALAIRADAWIAEFEARADGEAIEYGAALDADLAAVRWKWTFCKEWLRLGGIVTDQAQLREWASLLYDARSQSDARDVAREELASAAS